MTEPIIKQININDLKNDPKNARQRTETSSKIIRKSLEEFGACRSIVTDENGVIRAGNGTVEEAKSLGIENVLVVEVPRNTLVSVRRTDLTEEEWIKYGVADNTASDASTWNPETLKEISQSVSLDGFFPEDKLEEIFKSLSDSIEAGKAADEVGKAAKKPKIGQDEIPSEGEVEHLVKPGEIWQLGQKHFIACGDSTVEANIRTLLGDKIGDVGMVWSDVPYGINVVSKDGSLGGESTKGKYSPILGDDTKEVAYNSFPLCQKLFPSAVQIFWGANHYASVVTDSSCWIVWDKQDGKNVTFADCEIAWTNIRQPARVFKHIWDGFRRDSERGETRVHPAQKPVALCEWFFEKYGQANDVIFDPFLGSAPSIIAAHKMTGDRSVYGFELSPAYCSIVIERFKQFTGENAKLVGRLF